MRRLIAESRQVASDGNAPSTQQPWTVKRGDQDLQFRDPTELQRQIDELDRQHQSALEAERIRAQSVQQQLELLQAERARASQPQQTQAEFDKEAYARLFLDDPRKAQQYLWQHDNDLKNFFGGVAQKIVQLESDLATERQERAAELFVSQTPDYVQTPENFEAIQSIINGDPNLGWNYAHLQLAWARVKELGQAVLGDEPGGEQQVDEYVPAPPLLRGRSSQVEGSDIMREFENLPADKQRAYIESLVNQ